MQNKIHYFLKPMHQMFVAVMVLLLTGCAQPNTNLTPLPKVKSELQLTKVWSKYSVASTDDQYLRLQPVLQNGIIYAASATGQVSAIDAKSGKVLWKKATRTAITSGVAVDSQGVFVGTSAGNLLALNKKTGQWLWYQPTAASIVSAPLVYDGDVFVKTEDDSMVVFKADSGHLVWNARAKSPDLAIRLGGAPAVAQGILVVPMADGELTAFYAKSGQQAWSIALSSSVGASDVQRMIDAVVTPKVYKGVVYAVNYQGNLVAVALKTGKVLWQRKLSSLSGLVVANNTVYVSDVAGRVWSLNAKSGAVNWQQKALVGRSLGAVSLMGNSLVVGDAGGYLHWLSLTDGHLMEQVQISGRAIIAAPLVQGDRVYATAINGRLVAYQVKPIL